MYNARTDKMIKPYPAMTLPSSQLANNPRNEQKDEIVASKNTKTNDRAFNLMAYIRYPKHIKHRKSRRKDNGPATPSFQFNIIKPKNIHD